MPLDPRDIARLRNVTTRSISPENFDGAKGGGARATEGTGASPPVSLGSAGRSLRRWSSAPVPHFRLPRRRTWCDHAHLAHHAPRPLAAPWCCACTGITTAEPAVEVPIGDFFANGWGRFAQVSSSMIAANPHGGFNSYWPMPFEQIARLTVENIGDADATLYYQVTYDADRDVEELGYLHAQFRREQPTSRRRHVRDLAMASPATATMSAPISPGASTAPAGGARASSKSILTAMTTTRPSAAPAPRTTSAAPGTSTSPAAAIPNTPLPTSACHQ